MTVAILAVAWFLIVAAWIVVVRLWITWFRERRHS